MGEFELLDTDEPLGKRMERHAFDRLIMLSDGVFAIAITLAALEMHPPAHWVGLAGLWATLKFSLFAYAISFAVIAAYWTSHKELMSRMRRVDSLFTILCLAQLFLVALIPATTKLLYVNGAEASAVQGYATVLAACGFLSSAMWAYASFRPGLMLQREPDRRVFWARLISALIVPLFFSIILFSGGRHLILILYATLGFVIVRRLLLPWWTRQNRPTA